MLLLLFVKLTSFTADDQFECMSNLFKITDDRNQVLFSANRDEVVVGSDNLRVMGEGGTIFRKAVQTPLVRAPPGQDLRYKLLLFDLFIF